METSKLLDNKALLVAVGFALGFAFHSFKHDCPVAEPQIITKYEDKVETKIVYVPKESPKDADIEVIAPTTDLKVAINDKEFNFEKADDEQFFFDKNKLTMVHSSRANLNITVPVVDKTRRWSLGIGMSKDGVVGLVEFPIKDKEYIGGWVAGNSDYQMGGISVKF